MIFLWLCSFYTAMCFINFLLFSVLTSTIADFSCVRQLVGRYFTFNVTWTIPENWAASGDVIRGFRLSPHIVYPDGKHQTRTYGIFTISFKVFLTEWWHDLELFRYVKCLDMQKSWIPLSNCEYCSCLCLVVITNGI